MSQTLITALFYSYGMICSPRTLLWCIPDFPGNQPVCSESPCIQIQQLHLTAKLVCSKQAIQCGYFTTTCMSFKYFVYKAAIEIWLTSKFVQMCMVLHVLSVLIQCFSGLAPRHPPSTLVLLIYTVTQQCTIHVTRFLLSYSHAHVFLCSHSLISYYSFSCLLLLLLSFILPSILFSFLFFRF